MKFSYLACFAVVPWWAHAYQRLPLNAITKLKKIRIPPLFDTEYNEEEIETRRKLNNMRIFLLRSIWEKVAFPNPDEDEVEFKLSDYGLTRGEVNPLLNHFQSCKDAGGDSAFLMASQNSKKEDILILQNVYFGLINENEENVDGETFGEIDFSLLTETDVSSDRTIFPVEPKDEIVLADTKEWVARVIAGFSVCPFTISPERAGIPMGGVRYTVSRATTVEEAFLRYWEEVEFLQATNEKDWSTVLLVFPELGLFGNYELFEVYCESLQDSLCSSCMSMEDQFQLVFFHPKYQFRDGQVGSYT